MARPGSWMLCNLPWLPLPSPTVCPSETLHSCNTDLHAFAHTILPVQLPLSVDPPGSHSLQRKRVPLPPSFQSPRWGGIWQSQRMEYTACVLSTDCHGGSEPDPRQWGLVVSGLCGVLPVRPRVSLSLLPCEMGIILVSPSQGSPDG